MLACRLQLVSSSGITYRWGAAHQIGTMQVGLGQHSSCRAWSDLTPFERSTALEWALDVIREHQTSGWPIMKFAGRWTLSFLYHSTGDEMLPESAVMTRTWEDCGQARHLATSISS
jgi:hypothetical protein